MKPRIDRTNMVMITIKVGRSHKYSVDVRGEPPPELTWSWRDGVPLQNTESIKVI